jgi:hypothetical protein
MRLSLANVDVRVGEQLDLLPAQLRGWVDAIVTNLSADPPELSSMGYVPLPVHPSTATAYRYAVAERR